MYMYDSRNLERAFKTEVMPLGVRDHYGIRVNPNPQYKNFLLITNSSLLLVDSLSGQVLSEVVQFRTEDGILTDVSYTPDGRYFSAGTEEGAVMTWDAVTMSPATGKGAGAGRQEARLVSTATGHPAPVKSVLWSTRYAVMATACTNLALWLPGPQESAR
jgi:WD40 repeat protein